MAAKIIAENKADFDEAESVLNLFNEHYKKKIYSIEMPFSVISIKIFKEFSKELVFVVPSNAKDITVSEDKVDCFGAGFTIEQPRNEGQVVKIVISGFEIKKP